MLMSEARKLLLIGGGGHCRSVLDCIISTGQYETIGIIDKDCSASALNIPVVGDDADLPRLKSEGWTDAFISVGSIGTTALRRRLYQMVQDIGYHTPSIIDPTAIIARDVTIKEGSFIGKRAIVNTGCEIGLCAIVNSGAIVEHDCVVGGFSHISPGATLCGQVSIGTDTHIGAGAVVRQGITIGNNVLIGVGSVVVKNMSNNVKAYGNPCEVSN